MQNLPQDVLDDICESLHDSHRASLFSLSTVNKSCRAPAMRLIFRRIAFHALGRKRLKLDVRQWLSVLDSNDGRKYVRTIQVNGKMPLAARDTDEMQRPPWQLTNETWHGTDEVFGTTYDDTLDFDEVSTVSREEDQAWSPLSDFIAGLSSLADLLWDEPSQFPPSLLGALHTFHPTCRLHISTFRFRSLNEPQVSTHEIALARSPCLYSISVRYVDRDSDGHEDYNEEAVLRTVAGLAPNLKKVAMEHCYAASSKALMRALRVPRVPFKGLPLPRNASRQRAALTKLTLRGFLGDEPEAHAMKKWSAVTDLPLLRHFEGTETQIARHLQDGGHGLSRLHELHLTFRSGCDNMTRRIMLLDRPGLASLTLSSVEPIHASLFSDTLRHHGRTLRELSIPQRTKFVDDLADDGLEALNSSIPPFDWTGQNWPFQIIRDNCPKIEVLRIPMVRTNGDRTEAEIYHIIGQLPALRHLFLTLFCSRQISTDVSTPQRRDFLEIDLFGTGGEYARELHKAVMNNAMDETLARCIFEAVSAGKSPGSHRLESLKLHPFGGIYVGDSRLDNRLGYVVHHIARSWKLERSPADDSHEIFAVELGKRAREARVERHPWVLDVGEMLSSALDRIWDVPADGSWKDCWRSEPLECIVKH